MLTLKNIKCHQTNKSHWTFQQEIIISSCLNNNLLICCCSVSVTDVMIDISRISCWNRKSRSFGSSSRHLRLESVWWTAIGGGGRSRGRMISHSRSWLRSFRRVDDVERSGISIESSIAGTNLRQPWRERRFWQPHGRATWRRRRKYGIDNWFRGKI